ncbi:unnamed protein product [Blepharisma stoltei]|uniref:Uncharacterized protein n=1 Tax=Blepharisma stoltei TaxID=1481888 RepID=A0AAU9JTX3_9CILI|nr:unnamed protein product [Blepharisma stoltei]
MFDTCFKFPKQAFVKLLKKSTTSGWLIGLLIACDVLIITEASKSKQGTTKTLALGKNTFLSCEALVVDTISSISSNSTILCLQISNALNKLNLAILLRTFKCSFW